MIRSMQDRQFIVYGYVSCPFCKESVSILQEREEKYFFVTLGKNSKVLAEIKKAHDWPTVPVVMVKGAEGDYELIGGCSELKEYLEI